MLAMSAVLAMSALLALLASPPMLGAGDVIYTASVVCVERNGRLPLRWPSMLPLHALGVVRPQFPVKETRQCIIIRPAHSARLVLAKWLSRDA